VVVRGVRSYCRDCEFGRERGREHGRSLWMAHLLLPPHRLTRSRHISGLLLLMGCNQFNFISNFQYWLINFDICCVAVNVPCRIRIWLSKSIWFFNTNKCGDVTWILYSSYSYRLLPYYWPLDYVFLLSSLSILQFQIVSSSINQFHNTHAYCSQNVNCLRYLAILFNYA